MVGLDWWSVPNNFKQTILTGGDILKQSVSLTDDGLEVTFASNLFGHFMLVRTFGVCSHHCVNLIADVFLLGARVDPSSRKIRSW